MSVPKALFKGSYHGTEKTTQYSVLVERVLLLEKQEGVGRREEKKVRHCIHENNVWMDGWLHGVVFEVEAFPLCLVAGGALLQPSLDAWWWVGSRVLGCHGNAAQVLKAGHG